jgi:hypothetical protein
VRLATLSLLLVLTAPVLAHGAGAAAKKHGKCSMPGSKTLAADSRGRVFAKYNSDEEQYVYACLYRSGRRFPIGQNPHDDFVSIDLLALASPFVAYGETWRSSHGSYESVERLDLRSGRIRLLAESSTEGGDGGVDQLVATQRGAAAWLVYVEDASAVLRVEKLDAAGHAVLDPGPGVEAGSLAVTRSGRRVYWSNGGQPRSAALR